MKQIIALCLGMMMAAGSFAQKAPETEEKGFSRDKLFIGGNFGLSFGNYTFVNLSPQLGYRFNRFLAAGAGINFQYVSDKVKDFNDNLYSKQSQGVAGLNIFGRVYPIQYLMLQVQPEMNYVFGKNTLYQPSEYSQKFKKTVPSVLVGGGVVLPTGRSALIISLMYDVLQKEYAPYGERPMINVGYNVGL